MIQLQSPVMRRDDGYVIRSTPQQGMLDDELWSLAQGDVRLLVTTDKGFTSHRDEDHFGFWSCVCISQTSSESTLASWLRCGNILKAIGRV